MGGGSNDQVEVWGERGGGGCGSGALMGVAGTDERAHAGRWPLEWLDQSG